MYRCRVVLLPAFIQQLAVAYVARGYWFYVSGWIPFNKDAEAVDLKLIEKYGIDMSKWERARRKKAGLANLHYLRHGRTFILIATHGQHRFFEEEAAVIRDIRRVPFKLGGYSVSYRNGHASVRIAQESYKRLRTYLTDLAPRRSAEHMGQEFRMLHFEPYAPRPAAAPEPAPSGESVPEAGGSRVDTGGVSPAQAADLPTIRLSWRGAAARGA